jgi:hypothetical protein
MMKEKLLSLFYHFVVAVCVLWVVADNKERGGLFFRTETSKQKD